MRAFSNPPTHGGARARPRGRPAQPTTPPRSSCPPPAAAASFACAWRTGPFVSPAPTTPLASSSCPQRAPVTAAIPKARLQARAARNAPGLMHDGVLCVRAQTPAAPSCPTVRWRRAGASRETPALRAYSTGTAWCRAQEHTARPRSVAQRAAPFSWTPWRCVDFCQVSPRTSNSLARTQPAVLGTEIIGIINYTFRYSDDVRTAARSASRSPSPRACHEQLTTVMASPTFSKFTSIIVAAIFNGIPTVIATKSVRARWQAAILRSNSPQSPSRARAWGCRFPVPS
jgi:hypothetical protein